MQSRSRRVDDHNIAILDTEAFAYLLRMNVKVMTRIPGIHQPVSWSSVVSLFDRGVVNIKSWHRRNNEPHIPTQTANIEANLPWTLPKLEHIGMLIVPDPQNRSINVWSWYR
jgi:hypothetical protein